MLLLDLHNPIYTSRKCHDRIHGGCHVVKGEGDHPAQETRSLMEQQSEFFLSLDRSKFMVVIFGSGFLVNLPV